MKVTTNLHVTLELTAEEAKWLHAVMQNPLSEDCNPDHEDPHDKKMREAFYQATAESGVWNPANSELSNVGMHSDSGSWAVRHGR